MGEKRHEIAADTDVCKGRRKPRTLGFASQAQHAPGITQHRAACRDRERWKRPWKSDVSTDYTSRKNNVVSAARRWYGGTTAGGCHGRGEGDESATAFVTKRRGRWTDGSWTIWARQGPTAQQRKEEKRVETLTAPLFLAREGSRGRRRRRRGRRQGWLLRRVTAPSGCREVVARMSRKVPTPLSRRRAASTFVHGGGTSRRRLQPWMRRGRFFEGALARWRKQARLEAGWTDLYIA